MIVRYICSATNAAGPALLRRDGKAGSCGPHDPHRRQLRQPLCPQGPGVPEPQGPAPTRSTRSRHSYGNDEFERLSPLRRIPVLVDGDFSISDSSVICAYLDEAYPGHPLLPADPKDRARARWFEEFADTPARRPLHLGPVLPEDRPPAGLGRARRPGADREDARTRTSRPRSIISSGELPADGFLFGEIGVADIAIASFFRNGAYAGFETDADALAAHRRLRRADARPPVLRRSCCSSRMCSAAPRSRAGARRCSMPARR